MNVVFVTGNPNKAKYFSKLVGYDIPHQKADTPEIQSLDLAEVVTEKAKTAYAILGTPVIVEDTSVIIHSMGRLPGTFIKWFYEELGAEKLCRLADISEDRSATAAASFAYYDGVELHLFEGGLKGSIAEHPRGNEGFGWNPVFIPESSDLTFAEMDSALFETYYLKVKHFKAVKMFLDKLEA